MKKIIVFSLLVCSFSLHSQSIGMYWPAFKGKTYDFIIFQGSRAVTIQQDTVPEDGRFVLTVPEQYRPYSGMSRWLFTNSATGGGLDMAITGKDFSVSCPSITPNEGNIVYKGADPVNELNRLYREQQAIIDKFEAMRRAGVLYDKSHALHAVFRQEREVQSAAYESFAEDLRKNPSHSARILPILNLVNGIPPKLEDDPHEAMSLTNGYITHELDFDQLYTSGKWTEVIQIWVELQEQLKHNEATFAVNFDRIGKRITAPEKFTDFVGRVTFKLNEAGKDSYIQAITPLVLSSNKITSYEGKTMQVYVKGMIGSQAPDLMLPVAIGQNNAKEKKTTVLKSGDLATNGYKQTLLVFYKSTCGPCEQLMQELPKQYTKLKDRGIRLITLSADETQEVFEEASLNYPWPDKYCDLKGMGGINFSNYAVSGTPTMFLIDKKGKIVKKDFSLAEILKRAI